MDRRKVSAPFPVPTWLIIAGVLVIAWWMYNQQASKPEAFEIADFMSVPPDPAYEDATPLTLIQLYKGNNVKMATDLRSLGLPDAVLSEPKNYPRIVSALKRLNMLPQ
jgi:hypothetical protein